MQVKNEELTLIKFHTKKKSFLQRKNEFHNFHTPKRISDKLLSYPWNNKKEQPDAEIERKEKKKNSKRLVVMKRGWTLISMTTATSRATARDPRRF